MLQVASDLLVRRQAGYTGLGLARRRQARPGWLGWCRAPLSLVALSILVPTCNRVNDALLSRQTRFADNVQRLEHSHIRFF